MERIYYYKNDYSGAKEKLFNQIFRLSFSSQTRAIINENILKYKDFLVDCS